MVDAALSAHLDMASRTALDAASTGRAARAAGAAGAAAGSGADGELGRAATEMEGVFLRMLLGSMMPEDGGGLFGSGPAAGIVREMFVGAVGDGLARRRALGIADLVEKSMKMEPAADPAGRPEAAAGRSGAAGADPVLTDLRA